jgi:hypothetical protein
MPDSAILLANLFHSPLNTDDLSTVESHDTPSAHEVVQLGIDTFLHPDGRYLPVMVLVVLGHGRERELVLLDFLIQRLDAFVEVSKLREVVV